MAQYWPLPSLLPALQLQVQAEEARNTTAEDEERPGGGGIGLQLEGVCPPLGRVPLPKHPHFDSRVFSSVSCP
jgi:hypothetical protein